MRIMENNDNAESDALENGGLNAPNGIGLSNGLPSNHPVNGHNPPPSSQQKQVLSCEYFRNFLIYLGQKYVEFLEDNPEDEAGYKILMEVIYCRMYLLNRPLARRIERLRLNELDQPRNNNNNNNNCSCACAAKHHAKVILHDTRLVKCFRKLSVHETPRRWFTEDMRPLIEFLLKLRPQFFADIVNPYLFGVPGQDTHLNGKTVVEKHSDFAVIAYALEHPELVATKLFPQG